MASFKSTTAVACLLLLAGCVTSHEARLQTAPLPPPSATPVQHTGRLWIELGSATWDNQCRSPLGQRLLCFDGVRHAAFASLERSLWTTFPGVILRDGDALAPGDYLLSLDVTLNPLPPDADGPGWSAQATGGFRLSRDGKILHEERLGSRSQAAFAYGSALGRGAGEVVDAFASHIAEVLGTLPEERPLAAVPLPAVAVEVVTPKAAPASLPEVAPSVPADAAPSPAAPAAAPGPSLPTAVSAPVAVR